MAALLPPAGRRGATRLIKGFEMVGSTTLTSKLLAPSLTALMGKRALDGDLQQIKAKLEAGQGSETT